MLNFFIVALAWLIGLGFLLLPFYLGYFVVRGLFNAFRLPGVEHEPGPPPTGDTGRG